MEAPGDPTAATFVPTCQGNSLHPCSPSVMRAHLGGVRQPRGCSGGRGAGELCTEVPGSPPVAGEDDLGGVHCAAEDELVEWWQDREEGWDSDTVLDDWDSVQTGDGYAEVHKMLFFPEGVDERPPDPEGQLLAWDRHILPCDLRGAVQQVPVQLHNDYRQFAAWYPEQPGHVIFIPGATLLVRNVSLRDLGPAPGMLLEMRGRLTGGAGDSHPLAALAFFRLQK